MNDQPPVFLPRASYRQRRIRDAARLMPVLGLVLWIIPLAWPSGAGDDQVGSTALIYVFGVWVVLIAVTGALAASVRDEDPQAAAEKTQS